MDENLIGKSLENHGEYLMKHFNNKISQINSTENEIYKNKDPFKKKLMDFIISKKEYLFNRQDNSTSYIDQLCESNSLESSNELFATIPPIELFLNVSKNDKKIRFFEDLKIGDILVGSVSSVDDEGLSISLSAVEIGKIRDITNLKIMSFCPSREIEDAITNFSIKDIVRGCVIKLKGDEIVISFLSSSLPTKCKHIKLGIITDDLLPLHCSETLDWDGRSYEMMLRDASQFQNPSSTSNLSKILNLNCNIKQLSFMEGIRRFNFSKDDFADQLRIKQSKRLADNYFDEGKKHIDEDRTVEAMQLINKALDVFPHHIEALVLRAFIYLNSKSYKRAIEDLDEAYRLDPTHKNTKKSLIDALMTYIICLQKEKKNREAVNYMNKALCIDPENEDLNIMKKNIKSWRSSGNSSSDNDESRHANRSSRKDHKKRLKLLSDSVNLSIEDADLSPESKRLLRMADSPVRFGPILPPQSQRKSNVKPQQMKQRKTRSSSISSTSSSSSSSIKQRKNRSSSSVSTMSSSTHSSASKQLKNNRRKKNNHKPRISETTSRHSLSGSKLSLSQKVDKNKLYFEKRDFKSSSDDEIKQIDLSKDDNKNTYSKSSTKKTRTTTSDRKLNKIETTKNILYSEKNKNRENIKSASNYKQSERRKSPRKHFFLKHKNNDYSFENGNRRSKDRFIANSERKYENKRTADSRYNPNMSNPTGRYHQNLARQNKSEMYRHDVEKIHTPVRNLQNQKDFEEEKETLQEMELFLKNLKDKKKENKLLT